ncbi:MAG: recombinase family protein, partial [Candidatus Promineifilaceae bacterium]
VVLDYVIGDYQATPEGQLNKHIKAVIAEYEREKIKERMVRGRRRKAKAGYVVLHGNTPYGYNAQKDDNGVTLVIDKSTAEMVRMIFELYTVRGWGSPKITRELNRLGIAPPSVAKQTRTPRAREWNQSQVMRIVKNETYAGTWHYGKRNRTGKNARDYHIAVDVPAIISLEVFEQAQLKRRTNTRLATRNTKMEYLLARRCFCGECQAPLHAITKKHRASDYSYYRCPVPHAQGTHYMNKQCSMTKHFRADYWDRMVWQEIRVFLADPGRLIKGIKRYQEEQETINEPRRNKLAFIEDLIVQRRKELGLLLDIYLSGGFPQDVLYERQERLEGMIDALEAEQESVNAQLEQTITHEQLDDLQIFAANIAEGLCEADEEFETRRRMLDYLHVKVEFSLEEGVEVAQLSCEFGLNKRIPLSDIPSSTPRNSSHRPESELSASSRAGEAGNCMPNYKHSTGCRRS